MKDCWKYIFGFLRLSDLLRCRMVCRWNADYIGNMKYFGIPIWRIGPVMYSLSYNKHNFRMNGDIALLYDKSVAMVMFANERRRRIVLNVTVSDNAYVFAKDNKISITEHDTGVRCIIDNKGEYIPDLITCFDTPNFKIKAIPEGYIVNEKFRIPVVLYFEFDKKLFVVNAISLTVYNSKTIENYFNISYNTRHKVCNDLAIVDDLMFFKGGDIMRSRYFSNIIAAGRDFLFAKINGKYTEIKS